MGVLMSIKDEILKLNGFVKYESKACYALAYEIAEMVEKHLNENPSGDSFEDAARPLIKYLCENHNPHTSVIVTSLDAELLGGIKAFKTKEYIKG